MYASRRLLFSSNYILSKTEYKKLIDILVCSQSPYSAFLISLLKEFNEDLAKTLRIINIGISGIKRIMPAGIYTMLVFSIKEAIILSNYKNFEQPDGFISITAMAKTDRFMLAYIDRQTIIRTFKKYAIEYTRR